MSGSAPDRFAVIEATPQPYAHVRRTARIAEIPGVMTESFATLSAAFARAGAAFAGPPLTHYLIYDAESCAFAVGFPAPPEKLDALREAGLTIGETVSGPVMTGRHVGPYDTLASTYTAMQAEMKAKGLEAAVDMWEIYMSPPGTPPDELVTEVIWPVRRS